MKIPASFRRPPFFQKETELTPAQAQSFPETLLKTPFYYDLTQEERPWLHKRETVPLLFALWRQIEPQLAACYSERKPQAAKQRMIAMSALYMNCLWWSHGRPVTSLHQLEETSEALLYKPVNIGERLHYVLSDLPRFHAFLQLKALFDEQQKIFAKMLMLEKRDENKRMSNL
ncbi:hypothetical protein M3202_05595 [Alkalihalobacillus oceani]|uniref:YpoC-like domain-containing protein n=1 Tax=Halalkalibacter oceani TaxID=1653776 RepID=A0A9X2DMU5_9BACI|nr:hypothetical protein [Halalkalibacter oceani]MCM3713549.1 hypothetical protein [Halalkalibacter oceani]